MVSYLSQGCRRSLVRPGAQQDLKHVEANPHPPVFCFSLIPLSRCLGLVLVPSAEDLRQLDDVGTVLIRQLFKGHGNSPDVVKLPQILSTWDEYQAETARQRDEAKKAYEQDQRRRANYQARFEKLNLGEHAELEEKNGWVRIRLDVLEVLLSPRPD